MNTDINLILQNLGSKHSLPLDPKGKPNSSDDVPNRTHDTNLRTIVTTTRDADTSESLFNSWLDTSADHLKVKAKVRAKREPNISTVMLMRSDSFIRSKFRTYLEQ